MDAGIAWFQLFSGWPADRPRQGIVVTRTQESIPFTQFMVSEGLLALERERPDTIGSRKVMLPFAAIEALKFTDTADFKSLKPLGFR